MKKVHLNLLYCAVAAIMALSSCGKEGEYSLTETAPLDFKTYYNGLDVTFVNKVNNASDISWNFGDNTADVTGDSVVHSYTSIGNYVISMNGTVDGTPYVFHTILRVDKASAISMTDNTFDDWNNLPYPDFQLEGKDHVTGGKMDYDANFVYIFLEYDTTGTNGLAKLDEAVMDLYMDTDNSLTTGFSSGIGAETLFEGNIPIEWFDYYTFTGEEQSAWSWDYVTIDHAVVKGHTEEDGNLIRMEFALSREALKINKDAFGFQLVLNYSDWSGELGSLAKDNETKIVMQMDKQ